MLAEELAELDVDDPHVVDALAKLKRECVEAKEALSSDVDTTIDVRLPGVSTSLRMTRSELEGLIASPLRDTLDATRRALRSAGLEAGDVAGVVLVGGSSRIPLVSHLLQSELGVRTAMDTHPKHDVALGAVRYQLPDSGKSAPPAAPTVIAWPTRARPVDEQAPATETPPPPEQPAGGPPAWAPPEEAREKPRRQVQAWGLYVALAALLAVLGLVAAFVVADPPSGPELSWTAGTKAGDIDPDADSRRTTLDASVLGIPLPGEVVLKKNGDFDVTQNLALFAAGPTDLFEGAESSGTLVRDPDDPWWRPVATIPGGFMVLAFLFAAAYAESQLRQLRRGRGGLRPGELAGLTGVGLVLGLCFSLLAWSMGRCLEWPTVIATIVCFGGSLGLLAFGISSRRRARVETTG